MPASVLKETTINLVTRIENTIQFPILVSKAVHDAGFSLEGPGLSKHLVECKANLERGTQECEYNVQWKSRCGTQSEDVQKYECLDATKPQMGLDCEHKVCRYVYECRLCRSDTEGQAVCTRNYLHPEQDSRFCSDFSLYLAGCYVPAPY